MKGLTKGKGKIKWQRIKTALISGVMAVLPAMPVLSILAIPSVQAANAVQEANHVALNQLADKLQLNYQLTASYLETCPAKETQCYRSAIELTLPTQLSNEELNHGDWQIYFS